MGRRSTGADRSAGAPAAIRVHDLHDCRGSRRGDPRHGRTGCARDRVRGGVRRGAGNAAPHVRHAGGLSRSRRKSDRCACRESAHRRQSVLGARTHAPDLCFAPRATARGNRAPTGRRGRGHPRRGHRGEPDNGPLRRRLARGRCARDDPLQRGRAGHRRVRHRARCHPRREGVRQARLGHRERDAALSSGRAPDGLGDGAGIDSRHADHRQHGRRDDASAVAST